MTERHPGVHEAFDGSPPVGRLEVNIPRLKPDSVSAEGKIIRPGNLFKMTAETNEELAKKPWYKTLLSDVRKHRKSAVFITSLGSIAIFVAGAAGFEFGVRHGRDLKILPKILKRKNK